MAALLLKAKEKFAVARADQEQRYKIAKYDGEHLHYAVTGYPSRVFEMLIHALYTDRIEFTSSSRSPNNLLTYLQFWTLCVELDFNKLQEKAARAIAGKISKFKLSPDDLCTIKEWRSQHGDDEGVDWEASAMRKILLGIEAMATVPNRAAH